MTKWLDTLTPDDYVSSVYDIDLDKLWNQGKRLLLTDLDNTLVPWNIPDVPQRLSDWLQSARDRGFTVCVVSNNEGRRVKDFADRIGIEAISAARKPRPDAFYKAMEQFHGNAETTVMVGDQLFTDVQGAKRAGVYSILVLPINRFEWWPTRIVRRVERLIMRQLVRRGRLTIPERR